MRRRVRRWRKVPRCSLFVVQFCRKRWHLDEKREGWRSVELGRKGRYAEFGLGGLGWKK